MADQYSTLKEQRDAKYQAKIDRRSGAARKERTQKIITWSIIGLVVAGVVAIIIFGGSQKPSAVAAVNSQDHIQGSKSAPVVLIEYSDFQCPACGAYYPVVKDLQKKYGNKLALVYRNFPLRQNHQYADLAARSAEAANLQNKFWEMHDLLFENQSAWSALGSQSAVQDVFVGYAKQLQLDTAKFTSDINSTAVKNRVDTDVNSGTAANIQGTPTFYLNGQVLQNPGSEDVFSQLIDKALSGK